MSVNTSFQLNKLVLFLGGTGSSSSSDYNALRLHCAELGFDFINLSYLNDVAAASLANSSDSLAFNKYRQEVCFGTPLSPDVSVDSLNAIYTRTLKLLEYLDHTFPSENWGQYLSVSTGLDWSKIIVSGHSQGSGHACYLAKFYLVDRVLMFSGPNDFSDFHANSANWVRQSGISTANRQYVYLSLYDEAVSFAKQYEVVYGLGILKNDDTTHVDHIAAPYGNSRCLYTTQPPGLVILDHNVPVKFSTINNEVWTYMLTSSIPADVENDRLYNDIKVFPNPASQFIHILADQSLLYKTYFIYNLSGHLIMSGPITNHGEVLRIDISTLEPAIYFVQMDNFLTKFIKE